MALFARLIYLQQSQVNWDLKAPPFETF